MEHNARLRDDLARPRIRVSEASARYGRPALLLLQISMTKCSHSLIRYCRQTKDHLVRRIPEYDCESVGFSADRLACALRCHLFGVQ